MWISCVSHVHLYSHRVSNVLKVDVDLMCTSCRSHVYLMGISIDTLVHLLLLHKSHYAQYFFLRKNLSSQHQVPPRRQALIENALRTARGGGGKGAVDEGQGGGRGARGGYGGRGEIDISRK